MRETAVIALLGPPPDESVSRNPHIVKYGGLQLAFVHWPGTGDRVLTNVGLYFGLRPEPIPEPTRPTDFNLSTETTMSEIRTILAQVDLRDCVSHEDEDTSYLLMPSGSRIMFEDQMLMSINFAAPAAKPPNVGY